MCTTVVGVLWIMICEKVVGMMIYSYNGNICGSIKMLIIAGKSQCW